MRRERNRLKRERLIMVTSSALVLAALTATGIYMRQNPAKKNGENYEAKLDGMEENTVQKLDEIAGNRIDNLTPGHDLSNPLNDYEMDYMPMELDGDLSEAGSNLVKIGEKEEKAPQNDIVQNEIPQVEIVQNENVGADENVNLANAVTDVVEGAGVDGIPASELELLDGIPGNEDLPESELVFQDKLIRPVNGTVIIPYNMNGYEYFKTMNYYKYNRAEIISAGQGDTVLACADGRVKEIRNDYRLGQMLVLDLGDGYEAVYGQLGDISVGVNDYVSAGQEIARVQNPTIFFSEEGSNLYFEVTADGVPVNPEAFY